MENSKSTKRALLTSVLALLMCVTMLVGATFAWFTDTASTGVNKIQAGNLDLEVEYRTTAGGDWKALDNATDLFGAEGTLFEPGHTRVVELRITNAGNLALKYKIGMNVVSETAGTNKDSKPYKLSDYLKVATTPIQSGPTGDSLTDQVAAIMEGQIFQRDASYIWTARDFANFELEKADNGNVHSLQPGEMQFLGIKVYMPESVGNEANAKTPADAASINFGLHVVATQYTVESDSYGTQYDKDATYPAVNQAELTALLNGGKIVTLGKDIAPTEAITVSGNVKSTLDLDGKKLANTKDIWETTPNSWSLVSARSGANLTITGNGTFAAKANDCYAVDVQDGSTVTITSGTFNGNIHAVYVLEGTAIIQGGFYSVQQKYPDSAKADEFVLNCYDANRANGTAKIIVTGGTFVNFNPADCQAEGAGTNFVADGYKVVAETQTNGDVWYTVVPK